jgi:DNA primase
MRGLIPPDIIQQIRERVDITDVVSAYVTLGRGGQNLKGICPFHAEKTPSFMVNPAKQIFHCFGCGTGGNVFTFLMKIEGTSFPEAVRELGRRAGITVPAVGADVAGADTQLHDRLMRIHETATAWFQRNLLDPIVGREASAYLRNRGIEGRTIEAFRLGVAPTGWDGLLRALSKDGFSPSDLAAAGLAVSKDQGARDAARYYDRFRDRLMVPILDLHHRPFAFGGRTLCDAEPKYLNSPETAIFNKSRTLYALGHTRSSLSRSDHLIIVEGYFDAIALHQAGITNAVATLGTALTPDHLRTIRRYVNKVVLLFDPDPAGIRAALRTLDLFVGSGIGVTVVSLPDGEDPDAFIRAHGAAAFQRLQENAPSLLDFAVEHSLRGAAAGSLEERIRSIDEILRILQKTDHRLEKEECLRRVAERLGIRQERLVERYPELPSAKGRPAHRQQPMPAAGRNRNPEEWDLAYLLVQGRLTGAQVGRLSGEAFSVPACRRIVEIALKHVDRDGRILIRPFLDEATEDPHCQSAATELSVAERHFEELPSYIEGCLQTLERKQRQQRLTELIARLRTAEQQGCSDEVSRLNALVNELREKKAAVPSIETT